MLQTEKDSILLQRMKEDDQSAFSIIYKRYWEDLFITAAKALRNRDAAADVVQDVFLSIWNRRKKLHVEGPLAAYLRTSAKYKAIHYIEKNITRQNYLSLLTNALASSMPASTELKIYAKEIEKSIQEAVDRMPPKMQRVYLLSRHENMTHKQIAAQIGIAPETVKKHIQQALQLIKTALEKHTVAVSLLLFHLISQ